MTGRILLILMASILSGCGPLVSGTWSDDSKNWKRAFDEPLTDKGISIVHSWYMRTPHFTAEYAWFFELRLDKSAKQAIITDPNFTKTEFSSEELSSHIYQKSPSWFRPEPLSDYDIYESKTERDFIILIEKNGSRSFWTRYQL